MSIMYERDAALRQGIAAAGSILGGALQQRALEAQEQKKRGQYGDAIARGLEQLGPNPSAIEQASFINTLMEQGVPPAYIKLYSETFKPGLEASARQQGGLDFLERLGVVTPEAQVSESIEAIVPDQRADQISQPEMPISQPPRPQQRNILESLSDTQLVAMQGSGIPQAKSMADAEMKRREIDRRNFREDRKFAYGKAAKFFDKLEEEADSLADKKAALANMKYAIQTGDMGFFSRDNFANFLGKYGEGLRTATGSLLLNAQKEFLVSNIGRVGPRPNQWIEQQISSALTKIGRSDEANLSIVEALQAQEERSEEKQRIVRNLEDHYLEKDGMIPANFTNIVREAMQPVEERVAQKLSYRLRKLHEQENSDKMSKLMNKKVPSGTPLTVEMAAMFLNKYGSKDKAVENAKKMGYTIPTPDQYRRYIQ